MSDTQRLLTMLAWGLGSGRFRRVVPRRASSTALWRSGPCAVSFSSCSTFSTHVATRAAPSACRPRSLSRLHARYSRAEVVAALGYGEGVKPKVTQGGILWVPEARATSSSSICTRPSATTRRPRCTATMRSTAELFHWESQSRQTPRQPTVQRYINHQAAGTACCSSFASEGPSNWARAPSLSSARSHTLSTAVNGRLRSRGDCLPPCLRTCLRSPGVSRRLKRDGARALLGQRVDGLP